MHRTWLARLIMPVVNMLRLAAADLAKRAQGAYRSAIHLPGRTIFGALIGMGKSPVLVPEPGQVFSLIPSEARKVLVEPIGQACANSRIALNNSPLTYHVHHSCSLVGAGPVYHAQCPW